MRLILMLCLAPALIFSDSTEEINHKIQWAEYVLEEADIFTEEDINGVYFYKGKIEAYKECLDIIQKEKSIEKDTP